MADKASFTDEAAAKDAIADVRNDSTETNWVLFTYEQPKSPNIVLLGKGSDGLAGLCAHLKDDIVGYGLIRKTERIDESTTVKFAFINWIGEAVPRMQKARISIHRGTILGYLAPFHVDITASTLSEISDEIIEGLIGKASGTSVNVLSEEVAKTRIGGSSANETPHSAAGPRSNTATKVAQVPKTIEKPIKFVDEEGVKADIKDVRSDSTDTNWVAVGYEGKKGNTIVLLGKGTGGLAELEPLLENDMVGYALLRKVERIDESNTVKFVFIEWIGDNIDRMHKARLGTHKGAIHELFAPYHVDLLQVNQKSELTEDRVEQKIKEAAGTFNKVKSDV